MATITIRVPAFTTTFECPATNEDEAWEWIDSSDIGNLAIEKATIVESETTYDESDDILYEDDAEEDS